MTTQWISDQGRTRALAATGLFDAPVPGLDRLARLAARSLGVRLVLVTLADHDRQVPVGTSAGDPGHDVAAVPHCREVVEGKRPVILTGYAGWPLRGADGAVLGAFSAVDTAVRDWTGDELATLADFAAAAESEIALRLVNDRLGGSAKRLAAVLDTTQDAYAAIDVDGDVVAWNAAAEKLFGWSSGEALGRQLTGLIVPQRYRLAHNAGLRRVRDTGESKLAGQRLQFAAVNRAGREFPIELTLQTEGSGDDLRFHAFLHDITEQVDARRQLEHDRSFLQALLDSLDEGVVACDSNGELALSNQAMRGVFGIDGMPGEGPQTSRLFDADGRTPLEWAQAPLARAYAGEDIAQEEVVIRYADGGDRRFTVRGRPIQDTEGQSLGAVVAVQDITERHRRDRLHAAQHAVARVLAEAPSYQEVSAGVVAAVGEALGWTVGEYWEVDEERQVLERLGSWVADRADVAGFTGPERLTFQRGQGLPGLAWASGRTEWVVDMATDPRTFLRGSTAAAADLHAAVVMPIRGPESVLGVLLFVTDHPAEPDTELVDMLDGVGAHLGRYIERRRAEEVRLELADARREFDRVMRQISDFICSVEVLPDGAMPAVFVSPNGQDVFGGAVRTGADLRAEVARLVDPDDMPSFEALLTSLAEGVPAEAEVRVRGLDDVTRWVWVRAVPRRVRDRQLVDAICTNVTERHRLAERREALLGAEREQVRQLRAVDRLKDELIALVTHELRNPIASISGYVELLQNDDGPVGERSRFVSAIARQSSHLQRLVDDLLELARIDAGQVPIEPRPTSLTRLVREALDNHRLAADARDVTVHNGVTRILAVAGDPFRLRQVLDNLLSNAIKYTTPGGTVTVSAEQRGNRVRLSIADTGIGIPEDEYPKLFTRFFRASTAVAGKVEGTGLGLAITKAIVERHGGTITACANPGSGTIFTVELPAAAPGCADR